MTKTIKTITHDGTTIVVSHISHTKHNLGQTLDSNSNDRWRLSIVMTNGHDLVFWDKNAVAVGQQLHEIFGGKDGNKNKKAKSKKA